MTEPPRKLKLKPGESVWEALAREVASNPESPVSLRLLSQVNLAMRPRMEAGDQLAEALADQIERPSAPEAQAAVDAAIMHWGKVCGDKLDADLVEQFRAEAEALHMRRRRQPPDLGSIVQGVQGRTDMGYQLGLDLEGLRGTWHRLWAGISMAIAWGETLQESQLVRDLRGQFESQLGRPLAAGEWEQLTAHARRHSEAVMQPMLQEQPDLDTKDDTPPAGSPGADR